jgi:hypothetical protein
LYVLDQQVHFLSHANTENIARGISRRYIRCMSRMAEAMRGMAQSGVQEANLQDEWRKQVQAQTKPERASCAAVWNTHTNIML